MVRQAHHEVFDELMVRRAHHEAKPLKTRGLILSLSKDEAKISCFFSVLPDVFVELIEGRAFCREKRSP